MAEREQYITLDDLKMDYLGDWDEANDDWAARQIDIVGAHLRATFKQYGRDLDAEIADGTTDSMAVGSVASAMVLRKLSSSQLPFGGAFAQMSEGADGYSRSISTGEGSARYSTMYLRRDERRLLGLPGIVFKSIGIDL